MSVSGLSLVKKEAGTEGTGGVQSAQKEPVKWKDLISDLSIILKKFPREVAFNVTLFQAIEIKRAEHRVKQFEGAIHGAKIPDIDDSPLTQGGKKIATEADLNELLGLLN